MGGSARAVLVTGGAGYIGSHAAKALHAAGYRVVVYDSLTAGHRGAVRYGELVEGDINDVAALRAAMGELSARTYEMTERLYAELGGQKNGSS